jgi:hypothetical protein
VASMGPKHLLQLRAMLISTLALGPLEIFSFRSRWSQPSGAASARYIRHRHHRRHLSPATVFHPFIAIAKLAGRKFRKSPACSNS